jgi:hypothetical protein
MGEERNAYRLFVGNSMERWGRFGFATINEESVAWGHVRHCAYDVVAVILNPMRCSPSESKNTPSTNTCNYR